MHASSAAAQLDRMLQVQHLVIDDVLQNIMRHRGMVEDAADDDGIVRRVVVPKNPPGPGLAPAHSRAGHQAMKKARVQCFEYRIKIVEAAARRTQQLAPAY